MMCSDALKSCRGIEEAEAHEQTEQKKNSLSEIKVDEYKNDDRLSTGVVEIVAKLENLGGGGNLRRECPIS